jgi:ketosteroid isomerase-like protein
VQSTSCCTLPRPAKLGDARRPHWRCATTLALATLFALAGCGHAGFSRSDDVAVRGVLLAQLQAWNRGDLDGYMRGYVKSDELVFTSGGKVRRGWDETYAKYKAKYGNARSTMGTLAFEILGVQALGADGAIVLGRWSLTNTPVAGSGVFSVALERTKAGWVVVHDHTSADPPP